jgi:hypothetical protein
MLFVTVAGLLSWFIARRKVQWKWSLVVFLLVTSTVSLLVMNNVRTAGVIRDDTRSEGDLVYSIVYYNSIALFPFVVQKHNNWTATSFVYYIRFLNQDGNIVSQTSPAPDQSEFMHLALLAISVSLCFQGFIIAMLAILGAEFIIWWRKPNRVDILRAITE